MRIIGHIPDESQARRFGDFLLTQGMENDVEPSSQGWAVWVHNDDLLSKAGDLLKAFLAAPDDARFADVSRTAGAIRKETEKAELRRARLHIDVRTSWHRRMHGARPLTGILIFICLLVGGATKLGVEYEGLMDSLLFGSMQRMHNLFSGDNPEQIQELLKDLPPSIYFPPDGDEPDGWYSDQMMRVLSRRMFGSGFKEIGQGEVWRLITPIFLHFGWLHLVFNLFWLFDLGGLIEIRKGSLFLALFILVVAVASNVSQCWMDGPLFGGMSGVMYGLFGYIWMKQRYQPHLHIALAPNTVAMMLGWLVLCMTGAFGPIANTAHVVGLACGAAIGVAGPIVRQWRKRAA